MGVTNVSLGRVPNGWTDWHQIRSTSVDSSGNGHRLKTIRPTIPHGGILEGFRGSTIQKPGKCGQTARLEINFAHIMQVNLGMNTG